MASIRSYHLQCSTGLLGMIEPLLAAFLTNGDALAMVGVHRPTTDPQRQSCAVAHHFATSLQQIPQLLKQVVCFHLAFWQRTEGFIVHKPLQHQLHIRSHTAVVQSHEPRPLRP